MFRFLRSRRRRAIATAAVVILGAIIVTARAFRGAGRPWGPTRGTVRRVLDGDTFDLDNGSRVRLLDIDAPERDAPLGQPATEALRRLVEGRRVRLAPGPRGRDGYGRFLRYVFVEQPGEALAADGREVLVNSEIVRLGLARARVGSDSGDRAGEILAAEREAREARRGMWGAGP